MEQTATGQTRLFRRFYGTTSGGGADDGRGTIFKLTAEGTLTSLFSFNGTNGANPTFATLLETADGVFYGTTLSGGMSNRGTVFRLSSGSLNSPQLTVIPSGAYVILTWPTNFSGFTLQSAPVITGTFTNILGATSPYTNAITGSQQYFRLKSD